MRAVEILGSLMPYRKSLDRNLKYAGYSDVSAVSLAGTIAVLSLIAAAIILLVPPLFGVSLAISAAAAVASVVALHGIWNLRIIFKAEKRGLYVDKVLADALQLIASNVRSGMTVDRAVWLSARPEFGPLAEEIKKVSTEIIGVTTLADALSKMSDRIKSDSLDRAVKLIVEGLKGGGEMANLLDNIAIDVRRFQTTIEENRTNVMTYSIFIVLASIFAAPMLFGMSTFFVETMNSVFLSQSIPTSAPISSPINIGQVQIDIQILRAFAVASILTIAFFSALLTGLIHTGRERNGLKYAPFMMGIAILVYFAARALISSVFGFIAVG